MKRINKNESEDTGVIYARTLIYAYVTAYSSARDHSVPYSQKNNVTSLNIILLQRSLPWSGFKKISMSEGTWKRFLEIFSFFRVFFATHFYDKRKPITQRKILKSHYF